MISVWFLTYDRHVVQPFVSSAAKIHVIDETHLLLNFPYMLLLTFFLLKWYPDLCIKAMHTCIY
jgi:hypothetical protein